MKISISFVLSFLWLSLFGQSNARLLRVVNDSNKTLSNKITLIGEDSLKSDRDIKQLAKLKKYTNIRLDNTGSLQTHRLKVLEAIRIEERKRTLRTNSNVVWSYDGPNSLIDFENSYTPLGLGEGIGRISCLWLHPENPDILFAGANSGGLWKTTNAMDDEPSWMNLTDGSPIYGGVYDIAVDPNNTNIIFIICKERANGLLFYGIESYGVYKTTNGGFSWTDITGIITLNNPNEELTAIEMHPSNSQVLILTTNKTIYKSTNSGSSWNVVYPLVYPDPHTICSLSPRHLCGVETTD